MVEQNDMTKKENTTVRMNISDRISSPDQLRDYLRVTSPGIWVLLASIVLFLAGVFVWFSIGTLETVISVKVSVEEQRAMVIPEEACTLLEGMPLRMPSGEYTIGSLGIDEYGRNYGIAEVDLPDGIYDGTVVTEKTHPISFLLESR